jgi:predicted P-loop ATPase
MTDTTTASALAYYAANGAALFPIPAGQKAPTGIIASFKHDFSRDPAQWNSWAAANLGCNFGVVAFASQWIIADIDTSVKEIIDDPEKLAAALLIARQEAWTEWCEVCASWGVAPINPSVQSARGGWHIYFQVPPEIDASQLRQPDLRKDRINIRCVGFTIAAGSYYDGTPKGEQSGPYLLLSDAPPHPAPQALLEHCTRAKRTASSAPPPGSRDAGDVAGLLTWLNERDAFSAYEDWLSIGMALKLEFGDAGLDLWALTHDHTVDADTEASKWASFATEPTPDSVTLASFLDRAHKLGWRGSVRKSTSSMFDGVAAIAAAAGASLHSGMPLPSGAPGPAQGMPMLAGQEELTRLSTPILQSFLTATSDAPTRPISDDYPTLPPAMESHGLYSLLNECIARVTAMAEPSAAKWKPSRIKSAMAVLLLAHADVFEAVRRRVEAMGRSFPIGPVKIEAKGLEDQVQRAFVKQDDWIYDKNGLPEANNPDNVSIFLAIIGGELRWNAWLHRAEIRGFEWQDWTAVDDLILAKLKVRAYRTGTRFLVGDEFLKSNILALANDNPHDPVLERIAALKWDGVSRLNVWLTATCGVPCDLYHQAVGRNVIGGMVKRARRPGAKHDEVMILMGPQGTAKSELCRTLSMDPAWFTDSVTFDGSPQNIVPQLFGKLVVELAELDGMAKKEVQSIKRFISSQSDNVTLKYKAFASDFDRRCVFVGTSNEDAPLVDVTGNRRFLPVRIKSEVNIPWLRANIEQIVAEAAVHEAVGADFSIPRDVWEVAATHQEAARAVTDIETLLNGYFAESTHTGTAYVTLHDLAELCEISGWKRMESLRNAIMRKMRFRELQPYIAGEKCRVWFRGPEMLPRHIEAQAVRYMVGKTTDGRARVTIRSHATGVAI